jgi:tetratricopeptide (TPR) repeat protein/O-antigen ligase
MIGPPAGFLIPAIGSLIRWGIMFLLAFATLTFGGVPLWAGTGIILGALVLMFLWLIRAVCLGQLEWRPSPIDLHLALFLGLILLQLLLGYPIRLNQSDLGRRLLQAAGAIPGGLPFLPGTLDYHATRWALLFFLAYTACFYLVLHTTDRREHLTRLLLFIAGMAGAAGIYGLLEYLSGNNGVLGMRVGGGGRVRGTFIGPDHFATLLAMALFVGLGMLMGLGRRRRRRSSRREGSHGEEAEERERHESLARRSGPPQDRLFQQVLLMFVLGLVGTALIFTMSRGALLSVLLAGGVVAGMLGIHESLGRRRLLAVAALLVIGGFALWIGLGPVLDRFGEVSVGWSERLTLYRQALGMVRDFPILGTGFGTFGSVFPRYQAPPLGLDVRFSHAHNDLLQLAIEGGVVSLGILALALWGLFREVAAVRILGLARPAHPWTWRGARVAGSAVALVAGLTSVLGSSPARRLPALAAWMGAVLLLAAGSSVSPTLQETQEGPSGQGPPPASERGERKELRARRRDSFNVGIALGGLGALVAVLIHSGVDFSLRIPANALLLSVLLAVTLQAARVRFHSLGFEHLSPVVVVSLRGRRGIVALVLGAVIVGWLSWITLTSAIGESRIAGATEMIEGTNRAEQGRTPRPWVVWTRRSAGALSLVAGAVRLDSSNPDGHLEVGRVYEGLGLRAWNTGLAADGRLLLEPVQRVEEGRQLLSRALASFERAAYLAPMHRRAWGEIGWVHGLLAWALPDDKAGAEHEASLVAFRRAMALRPKDPYPFQLQAEYAFQWAQAQRGRVPVERLLASEVYQAGIQASRNLVELQPTFLPEALNRVLLFTKDFGVIQTILPPHAPDFLFAARLLEDQGLSDISRQALETAVKLAPDEDRPIYYQYLAEDSIKRGNLGEAVSLLQLVLGLDPQNLDVRIMLGDALAQQQLNDRALREYQAAIETARGLSAPAVASPAVRRSSWKPPPPTRLEIVEGALRERGLLPRDQWRDPQAEALAALAAFNQRQGLPNLALPLWEQAVARDPGNFQIHYGYGESLDSVGAWIPAQGEYRKALELNPRDIGLRLRLADKYMRNGLSEQAIGLWQEVTRIRPANIEARLRLAAAYEKLGRHREAELEYDQIQRLEPGNEVARQGLARLRGRSSG